jgi:hypothetical protein
MGGMSAGAIAATIMQMEQQRKEQEQGGQGYGGTKGLMLNVADVTPFPPKGPRPMNLEGGMSRAGGGGRVGEVVRFPNQFERTFNKFDRENPVKPADKYQAAVDAQVAARKNALFESKIDAADAKAMSAPVGRASPADFATVRQALNSQDPRTQGHIQEIFSKMTPQQQSMLQQRLFGSMSPAPQQSATVSRFPGYEGPLPAGRNPGQWINGGLKGDGKPSYPSLVRGPKTEQAINASNNVTRIEPARTGEMDWGAWAKAQGFPSPERVRRGAPALRQNYNMNDNEIKLYFQQLLQNGEL